MTTQEKTRLFALLKKAGLVLAAGGAYAAFVRLTGWGIPCVFYLLTGKYCPGCGVSRMCMALLRLDLAAAARYNLLILCLLPFGVVLFLYKAWQYVRTGNTEPGTGEKAFYCIAFILCIAFTVLRNMDLIPFLRMP